MSAIIIAYISCYEVLSTVGYFPYLEKLEGGPENANNKEISHSRKEEYFANLNINAVTND